MPSVLMFGSLLSSDTWYSETRLSSSRACISWNSSASGPSGVVISITRLLAIVSFREAAGCRSAGSIQWLLGAHDEARDRQSLLEPERVAIDVNPQSLVCHHALDIGSAMVVSPVRANAMGGRRVISHPLLHREHEYSAGTQRGRRRSSHRFEGAEVDERVGRHD